MKRFSIKYDLKKFRRWCADRDLIPIKVIPNPNGSVLKPPARFKTCVACKKSKLADTIHFMETQGGNLSGKCRKCQREM